jgi:hypothetical protein
MQLWKVPQDELAAIVQRVSDEQYDGNISVGEGTQGAWRTVGKRVQHVRFTLRVNSSKAPGHRRSASPFGPSRRLIAACWHAHRDVMAAIFEAHPEARLKTSLADYRGGEDFEDAFPGTYYAQIGAPIAPVYMGEACDC